MGIRFAVDIGVASVGWAVVNDEYVVLESGVNIFPCACQASCHIRQQRPQRQMSRYRTDANRHQRVRRLPSQLRLNLLLPLRYSKQGT